MTALAWDQEGERIYQAGVDRGVLYLPSSAVVWNGLISVDETFNREVTPYYQDGQKYLIHQVLGEFEATLKAFTYPDEFEEIDGVYTKNGGLFVHHQTPKTFGLSYRTSIGDDLEGLSHGYNIHLLYNLRAIPDSRSYSSVGDQISPIPFSWKLSGIPSVWGYGYRATAHLSLKSTDLLPSTLAYLEGVLYGTPTTAPRLPSLQELVNLIENPPVVTVVNNNVNIASSGTDIVLIATDTYQVSGADVIDMGFDTWQFTY